MREEVDRILRTINETTDRDISLIEEREKNLKKLLTDIEKRIQVYFREMETRREADAAYSALTSQKPEGKKNKKGTYEELGKLRILTPAEPPPKPQAEGQPPKPEDKPPPEQPPSLNEQIRSLVKSGIAPAVIATRLGISIAEAEFAAALLERRQA